MGWMTSGNDVADLNKPGVDVVRYKKGPARSLHYLLRGLAALLSRFRKLLLQVANNIL
jgi:hypothetical protein